MSPREAGKKAGTRHTENISGKKEVKVARYSFSGLIPPKFEHQLRRHKQSFGKIFTTVVSDKDGLDVREV